MKKSTIEKIVITLNANEVREAIFFWLLQIPDLGIEHPRLFAAEIVSDKEGILPGAIVTVTKVSG